MNIIEAFKSGKRVRREGWNNWWMPTTLITKHGLLVGCILADDWEVEEPTIRITRTEYYNAYKTAECEAKESGFHHADVLAKWLGL